MDRKDKQQHSVMVFFFFFFEKRRKKRARFRFRFRLRLTKTKKSHAFFLPRTCFTRSRGPPWPLPHARGTTETVTHLSVGGGVRQNGGGVAASDCHRRCTRCCRRSRRRRRRRSFVCSSLVIAVLRVRRHRPRPVALAPAAARLVRRVLGGRLLTLREQGGGDGLPGGGRAGLQRGFDAVHDDRDSFFQKKTNEKKRKR